MAARTNQRLRTRRSIVDAAVTVARSAEPFTMGVIARYALVSETTAYRHFGSLGAVARAAEPDLWPQLDAARESFAHAHADDAATRLRTAAEATARTVLAHQEVVRAVVTDRFDLGCDRHDDGFRFVYFDAALEPVARTRRRSPRADALRLRQALEVALSAESLLALTDGYREPPDVIVRGTADVAAALLTAIAPGLDSPSRVSG